MTSPFRFLVLLAFLVCATIHPMALARADSFTPAQKRELGEFIKTYLVENPETLRAAIQALNKKENDDALLVKAKAIDDHAQLIYDSPNQLVVGAPDGDVTIVEFFDYNCHFCKGALSDLARLVESDPKLKIILKDFPVLGPGSLASANIESAVRLQLSGAALWGFHSKLLSTHGPVGETDALEVAKTSGVDMRRLIDDLKTHNAKTGIDEVAALADALKIDGTPTFIIGHEIVSGFLGYEEIKKKIDSLRQPLGHE